MKRIPLKNDVLVFADEEVRKVVSAFRSDDGLVSVQLVPVKGRCDYAFLNMKFWKFKRHGTWIFKGSKK